MFSRKKRDLAVDADLDFARAMEQLDLFSNKLETLKQSYNHATRQLSQVPVVAALQVVPTPIAAFQPQPHPPNGKANGTTKPSGRYHFAAASASETVDVHVRVETHQTATPQTGPKRTHSGRYYLQLEGAKDPEELRKMRDEVAKCGRVVDSGTGTASDPEAGWMEVAVRADDTGSFIVKLEELEVKPKVAKMIAVDPGEGRVQAAQLDLFRRKHDVSS